MLENMDVGATDKDGKRMEEDWRDASIRGEEKQASRRRSDVCVEAVEGERRRGGARTAGDHELRGIDSKRIQRRVWVEK